MDTERPDTKELLIERVATIIRGGQLMVMGVVDNDMRLVISSMGVNPQLIPDVLRSFADQIEREEAPDTEAN
jgi:hypothetical protein